MPTKIINSKTAIFTAKLVIFFCIIISLSFVFEKFASGNFFIQVAIAVFFFWLIFSFIGNKDNNDGIQKIAMKELLTEIDKKEGEWEEIRSAMNELANDKDFEGRKIINSSGLDSILTKMDEIDNEKERRIENDYKYYGYYKLEDFKNNIK